MRRLAPPAPRARPSAPRALRPLAALWLAGVLLSFGCAAPYTVRTAGKGKTEIHASVGGPFFANLGAAMPMPAIVGTVKYGITDDWDIHGSFHVLPAVFKMAGLDLGFTRRILQQNGAIPELTATFRLSALTSFHDFRAYPELEGYASYLIRQRALVYLGLSSMFDFYWPRDQQFRAIWGPVVGADVRFRRKYALGVAVRWISPQQYTGNLVVDYVIPQGMLFLQLGFHTNLGGW